MLVTFLTFLSRFFVPNKSSWTRINPLAVPAPPCLVAQQITGHRRHRHRSGFRTLRGEVGGALHPSPRQDDEGQLHGSTRFVRPAPERIPWSFPDSSRWLLGDSVLFQGYRNYITQKSGAYGWQLQQLSPPLTLAAGSHCHCEKPSAGGG